jgi:UDP-N-acetylmuramoyl-L-alanyl-D-glutamate--2,6-diaminopimelate ligase
MEVSSHALSLNRVDHVRFATAVFTNLTRDHLDFHGDMQHYFAAKRRLFEMLPEGAPAIINLDDPRGPELARSLPVVVTYAIDRPADVRARQVQISLEGLAFQAETFVSGRAAKRVEHSRDGGRRDQSRHFRGGCRAGHHRARTGTRTVPGGVERR